MAEEPKELSTIGQPIAVTIFGDLMFAFTQKGVFWWDEPCWRKLVKGEVVTPANEAATAAVPLKSHTFTAKPTGHGDG